jgi:nucleoprotein TPR
MVELSSEVTDLKSKVDLLTEQLARSQRDVAHCNEEIEKRSALLIESHNRESMLMSEIATLRSSYQPILLAKERLEKENSLLQSKQADDDERFRTLQRKISDLEKVSGESVYAYQVQLQKVQTDFKLKENEFSSVSKLSSKYKSEIESLQSHLKDVEGKFNREKDSLERRIDSLTRTVDAQKVDLQRATAVAKELQSKHDSAMTNAQISLEKAVADSSNGWKLQVQDLERRIVALNETIELNKEKHSRELAAVSLLSSFNESSNSVSAVTSTAIDVLKRNLVDGETSATALYARLQIAEESLEREKGVHAKVRSQLADILSQLEIKAPIIESQRRDYERALISHEELAKRLNNTIAECDSLRNIIKEKDSETDRLNLQTNALRMEVSDLSKQVQSLLISKSVSKADSADSNALPQWPSNDEELLRLAYDPTVADKLELVNSSSGTILDENILTFQDLRELQLRNQQLVRIVRHLASKIASSVSITSGDSKFISEKVYKQLLQEIEDLRSDREKTSSMVSSLIQQRDMLKTLLAQSASSSSALPNTNDINVSSQLIESTGESLSHTEEKLMKVTASISKLENQNSLLQSLLDNSKQQILHNESLYSKNLQEYSERISMARDEILELRNKLSVASFDSAQKNEKIEELKRLELETRTRAALDSKRVEELQSLLLKREAEVAGRDSEARILNDELLSLKKQVISLQGALEVSKAAEKRAIESFQAAQLESESQSSVSQSIQSLTKALASKDELAKLSLSKELQDARDDIFSLRKQLEHLQEKIASSSNLHFQVVADMQSKIDVAVSESLNYRSELARVKSENEIFLQQIASLEAQVKALSNIDEKISLLGEKSSMNSSQLHSIEDARVKAEQKVESLKNDLVRYEKEVSESKNREESLSKELAEVKAHLESKKQEISNVTKSIESRVQISNTENTELDELKKTLEAKNSEIESKNQEIQVRDDRITKLRTALKTVREQLAEMEKKHSEEALAAKSQELTSAPGDSVGDVQLIRNELEESKLQVESLRASVLQLQLDLQKSESTLVEEKALFSKQIQEKSELLDKTLSNSKRVSEMVKAKIAKIKELEETISKLRQSSHIATKGQVASPPPEAPSIGVLSVGESHDKVPDEPKVAVDIPFLDIRPPSVVNVTDSTSNVVLSFGAPSSLPIPIISKTKSTSDSSNVAQNDGVSAAVEGASSNEGAVTDEAQNETNSEEKKLAARAARFAAMSNAAVGSKRKTRVDEEGEESAKFARKDEE